MKRTTLFIDPALDRELLALARRKGQSMASVVREAVAQYVATAAKKTRARRPGFIAAGRSGRHDTAERHEELLFQVHPPGRRKPATAAAAKRPAKRRPARG